jgi:hypothetical protein
LDSGEEFHRPGGVSCRRTKGRWRRVAGAFYRRAAGRNGQILNEIKAGSNGELGRFPVRFPLEEEDGGVALADGAHMSARGREEGCTGSGKLLDGPRAVSPSGSNRSPRSVLYFYFFLSSFSFLFSLFLSYYLQI